MKKALIGGTLIPSLLIVGCIRTTTIKPEELGNDTTRTIIILTKDGREITGQYSKVIVNEREFLRVEGESRTLGTEKWSEPFQGLVPVDSVETIEANHVSAGQTILFIVATGFSLALAFFIWWNARGL